MASTALLSYHATPQEYPDDRLTMTSARELLLETARRMFGEKSFALVSMDDLTASVQLTRGALYYHFGSKEGLFEAVVFALEEEIVSTIKEDISSISDPWERFRLGYRCYIERLAAPSVQRILLRDAPSVLADYSNRSTKRACIHYMADQLDQLMQSGTIIRSDPLALSHLINGALSDIIRWIADSNDSPDTLNKGISTLNALLDGLVVAQRKAPKKKRELTTV